MRRHQRSDCKRPLCTYCLCHILCCNRSCILSELCRSRLKLLCLPLLCLLCRRQFTDILPDLRLHLHISPHGIRRDRNIICQKQICPGHTCFIHDKSSLHDHMCELRLQAGICISIFTRSIHRLSSALLRPGYCLLCSLFRRICGVSSQFIHRGNLSLSTVMRLVECLLREWLPILQQVQNVLVPHLQLHICPGYLRPATCKNQIRGVSLLDLRLREHIYKRVLTRICTHGSNQPFYVRKRCRSDIHAHHTKLLYLLGSKGTRNLPCICTRLFFVACLFLLFLLRLLLHVLAVLIEIIHDRLRIRVDRRIPVVLHLPDLLEGIELIDRSSLHLCSTVSICTVTIRFDGIL